MLKFLNLAITVKLAVIFVLALAIIKRDLSIAVAALSLLIVRKPLGEAQSETGFLMNHVPAPLREQIADGTFAPEDQKMMDAAVIGFVDIVSSAQISNRLDLLADFELKQRFLKAASQRAAETKMVVLNHTGDGFMFLANHGAAQDWCYNLLSFYESMTADFQALLEEHEERIGEVKSGLRFGVTSGPVVLGCLGNNPVCYTAVGPEVNLAARLCSQAEINQVVVSSRVWASLKNFMVGWSTEKRVYSSLKGFTQEIPAVHINRRFEETPQMLSAVSV